MTMTVQATTRTHRSYSFISNGPNPYVPSGNGLRAAKLPLYPLRPSAEPVTDSKVLVVNSNRRISAEAIVTIER